MEGRKFGDALWCGTKGGLIGGVSGALLGGVLGGRNAYKNDRKFWTGKLKEGGDNTIWGTMSIKVDGENHAWIELRDASGEMDTYATRGVMDGDGNSLSGLRDMDQEFVKNYAGDRYMVFDHGSGQVNITAAQKTRFDAFIANKSNVNWTLPNNCSGFATRAYNYTTGINIMGHPFGIPIFTPKYLGNYLFNHGGF